MADVDEVAVLPMPHKILGQDILAVVRLGEGASLDLETAREFLRDLGQRATSGAA